MCEQGGNYLFGIVSLVSLHVLVFVAVSDLRCMSLLTFDATCPVVFTLP